jgi:N utilization substance protein B
MPSRYKSRQTALQILFLTNMREQSVDAAVREYYNSLASEEAEPTLEQDDFAVELARGTVARLAEIDAVIVEHSQNWRIERMPAVDRNILRLAIYELLAMATPTAVVIDQALDLAQRFSSDESLPFLNGVLDAAATGLKT